MIYPTLRLMVLEVSICMIKFWTVGLWWLSASPSWLKVIFFFIGEALASISHVAKVTILTKTKDQTCGYKVEYKDGKPLQDKPKPCAGNQGTQITGTKFWNTKNNYLLCKSWIFYFSTVEDLFYNVPTRKRVLKSPTDEFKRITDVMTKYAIHNSGKVGLTLKKVGDTEPTVGTQKISRYISTEIEYNFFI